MGDTVAEAGGLLGRLLEPNAEADHIASELAAVEHRGDELLRNMHDRLATSFVTPLDREDIHVLAGLLDDAIDDIQNVGEIVSLAKVEMKLPELSAQIEILVKCAQQVSALAHDLRRLKASGPRIESIQSLESEADSLYRSAIAALFSGQYEPLDVMKLRDVVGGTERAIDGMEDIADLVDSIRVKQS